MEGLLQGLKCPDPTRQATIFRLAGTDAIHAGRGLRWRATQTLYWNGQPLDRNGTEYQALLDEAFHALFAQNAAARHALVASGDALLEVRSAEIDPASAVLTASELCSRLARLRAEHREQHNSGDVPA